MHEQLRSHLRAEPFVPFTLVMSDGEEFVVKHPEMAWLTKQFIYLADEHSNIANHLYLLHLNRIRVNETAA